MNCDQIRPAASLDTLLFSTRTLTRSPPALGRSATTTKQPNLGRTSLRMTIRQHKTTATPTTRRLSRSRLYRREGKGGRSAALPTSRTNPPEILRQPAVIKHTRRCRQFSGGVAFTSCQARPMEEAMLIASIDLALARPSWPMRLSDAGCTHRRSRSIDRAARRTTGNPPPAAPATDQSQPLAALGLAHFVRERHGRRQPCNPSCATCEAA